MKYNFLKYPSLTNQYAMSKSRDLMRVNHEDTWYRAEKIDGSNIALVVTPDGEHHFQTRNNVIDDFTSDKFKNYSSLEAMDFTHEIEKIKEYYFPLEDNHSVLLFGELYGAGIQKRTGYDLQKSGEHNVRFFTLMEADFTKKVYCISSLDTLLQVVTDSHRVLGIKKDVFGSLADAEPYTESHYGGVAEGEVWMPLNGQERSFGTAMYGVKWKTEKFAEVSRKKHEKHTRPDLDMNLLDSLRAYVTENRLNNILSHGNISNTRKSVGTMIKFMQEDIKTEYMRDNGIEGEEELEKITLHLRSLNKNIASVVLANLPVE